MSIVDQNYNMWSHLEEKFKVMLASQCLAVASVHSKKHEESQDKIAVKYCRSCPPHFYLLVLPCHSSHYHFFYSHPLPYMEFNAISSETKNVLLLNKLIIAEFPGEENSNCCSKREGSVYYTSVETVTVFYDEFLWLLNEFRIAFWMKVCHVHAH